MFGLTRRGAAPIISERPRARAGSPSASRGRRSCERRRAARPRFVRDAATRRPPSRAPSCRRSCEGGARSLEVRLGRIFGGAAVTRRANAPAEGRGGADKRSREGELHFSTRTRSRLAGCRGAGADRALTWAALAGGRQAPAARPRRPRDSSLTVSGPTRTRIIKCIALRASKSPRAPRSTHGHYRRAAFLRAKPARSDRESAVRPRLSRPTALAQRDTATSKRR